METVITQYVQNLPYTLTKTGNCWDLEIPLLDHMRFNFGDAQWAKNQAIRLLQSTIDASYSAEVSEDGSEAAVSFIGLGYNVRIYDVCNPAKQTSSDPKLLMILDLLNIKAASLKQVIEREAQRKAKQLRNNQKQKKK